MNGRFHVAGLNMEKENICPFCGAELKEEHFQHGDEDNGFGTLKRYWTCGTCKAKGAALYEEQDGNNFFQHELYKLGLPDLEKIEPNGVGVQQVAMRIPTSDAWDKLMDAEPLFAVDAHWGRMSSWVNEKEYDENNSLYRLTRGGLFSNRGETISLASSERRDLGFRPAFDIQSPDTLGSDIQDGDTAVVGTLYMNGVPVRVPQKPTSDGDIADYIPGAKLEMRPALDDPAYQVTGIKLGNILVADRNLIRNISYLDIEEALKPQNDEPDTKQEKDGICPICGAEVDFDGDHEIQDNSTVVPWICPECGAEGKQWHDIKFSHHMYLAGKDGMPLTEEQLENCDMESGDGICPICGAEVEFNGDQEIMDDTTEVSWVCPACEATGTQISDIVFSEHLDVISHATTSKIQRKAYELYKLEWMIRHGHTLNELLEQLAWEHALQNADSEEEVGIQEVFEKWEAETGFDGELYVCLDEFLGAEYLDAEYMKSLLNATEYGMYLKDVAALQAED